MTGTFATVRKFAVAAAIAAVGLPPAATTPAAAAEKLVMAVNRPASIAYGPWAMAAQMGYFAEEGIEFELVTILGAGNQIPQIVNKGIHVGHIEPDPMLGVFQPGRDRPPVRYVYNHYRRTVWEIVVKESSPLKSLGDLKGKKIGIPNFEALPSKILDTAFRQGSIGTGADVEFVNVTAGASALPPFMKGDVDALFTLVALHEMLPTRGVAIRRIPIGRFAEIMGHGFVAHEDTIRNNPKLLAGYGRATTKGTIACQANIEACVRMYWKQWPDQKPSRGSDAEIMAEQKAVMNAYFDKLFPAAGERWGAFAAEPLRTVAEVLHAAGQLRTLEIPYEAMFTNALVDDYNKFDAAAVVAAARALK
ncbi:MAG: ABC transporter substrate-binding protein [Reyranellaceae bacterium]